jgi:hypothetical protein
VIFTTYGSEVEILAVENPHWSKRLSVVRCRYLRRGYIGELEPTPDANGEFSTTVSNLWADGGFAEIERAAIAACGRDLLGARVPLLTAGGAK